ncbi:MAG: hypothetical protein NTZ16_12965, partial [Verrucomicrobia bacterium]|nr:hypothetical protein [Verrucomicrobiota bacterium]
MFFPPKAILAIFACLPLTLCGAFAEAESTSLVYAGFEDGLASWQVTGDVRLETAAPLEGKASLRIGPGAGSVSQRVHVGNGDHLWIAVSYKSEPANAARLIVRYLDQSGSELMRLDSAKDIKPTDKQKPGKLSFYMKEHPLTSDVEVVISKDSVGGYILADQIE